MSFIAGDARSRVGREGGWILAEILNIDKIMYQNKMRVWGFKRTRTHKIKGSGGINMVGEVCETTRD